MKQQTTVLLKAVGVFVAMNAAMLVGYFLSRWTGYRRGPKGSMFALEVFALFFAIIYYLEARRD
jgi:hypothetical protein